MSRSNLAVILRSANRLQDAVHLLEQTLEIQQSLVRDFPSVPQYQRTLGANYLNLGVMERAMGNTAKAEEAYANGAKVLEQLTAKFPPNPAYQHPLANCYSNHGNLLRETNRFPEAEQLYAKAQALLEGLVKKFPDAPAYRNDLINTRTVVGVLLSQTGREEQALKSFREAQQLDSGDAKSNNALAWFLATFADPKLRNPAEAVALAKVAVQKLKSSANSWLTLGVAQYRAGDWKSSLAALETSAKLDREQSCTRLYFSAMAYWQLNRPDEARRRYDQAVELMKRFPLDLALPRFREEARLLLGVEDNAKPKTDLKPFRNTPPTR